MNADQLKTLWDAYIADRSNMALRDQLVGHYLPWVKRIAYSFANSMRIVDRDNAVGDVLMKFALRIVPSYDGKRKFEPFAATCINRTMLDAVRRDQRLNRIESLDAPINGIDGTTFAELLEAKPIKENFFNELTATLPDDLTTVLWCRFVRKMSADSVGSLLQLNKKQVVYRTQKALFLLKKAKTQQDN